MVKLPKDVVEVFHDPEVIKTLCTVNEEGIPHSVYKWSFDALDNETLAFMELLETSHTYKNMLKHHWANKMVSVDVISTERNIFYQIKGEPFRFVREGPIWDQFLKRVWAKTPDADPAGVWVIRVKEVINQNYEIRRAQEEERVINQRTWRRIVGARP